MRMIYFLIFISVSFIAYAEGSESKYNNVPTDIANEMNVRGCKPIDNFYQRQGFLEPVYIYGITSHVKFDSVAFWCEKNNESGKYQLWLVEKSEDKDYQKSERFEVNTCKEPVEVDYMPGGLSKKEISAMSGFYLHSSANSNIPIQADDNINVSGYIIESGYDGDSTLYYCYQGEWYSKFGSH